jgi:hypothetical protein
MTRMSFAWSNVLVLTMVDLKNSPPPRIKNFGTQTPPRVLSNSHVLYY